MVDSKQNMSLQCVLAAKAANSILCCINRDTTSLLRDGITPLYLGLIRPYIEYYMQFWAPQCKKDINKHE